MTAVQAEIERLQRNFIERGLREAVQTAGEGLGIDLTPARRRKLDALDATGLYALEEVAQQLHATGRALILCGAREQPAELMHQAEFEEIVGHENICDNVQHALARAEEVFEKLDDCFVGHAK